MSAAEPTPPAPLPEGKGEDLLPSPARGEGKGRGAPAANGAPVSRRRRLLVVVLGIIAFTVSSVAARYVVQRVTGPKDDFGRFQGTWQLAPDGREKRFPITVRVTGDRWVYVVADKEQKKYLLALRSEADPKEIDLTQLDANDQPSAFVLRGIYTIDGDGAKIVAAPNPLPRPTAFDAPDGPPVWVLERP